MVEFFTLKIYIIVIIDNKTNLMGVPGKIPPGVSDPSSMRQGGYGIQSIVIVGKLRSSFALLFVRRGHLLSPKSLADPHSFSKSQQQNWQLVNWAWANPFVHVMTIKERTITVVDRNSAGRLEWPRGFGGAIFVCLLFMYSLNPLNIFVFIFVFFIFIKWHVFKYVFDKLYAFLIEPNKSFLNLLSSQYQTISNRYFYGSQGKNEIYHCSFYQHVCPLFKVYFLFKKQKLMIQNDKMIKNAYLKIAQQFSYPTIQLSDSFSNSLFLYFL